MNLVALRPSEWNRLAEDLHRPETQALVLEALRRVLLDIGLDGGADTDRVYTLAVQLGNAGAWAVLDDRRLWASLQGVDQAVLAVFLGGLPTELEEALAQRLATKETPPSLEERMNAALNKGRLAEVAALARRPAGDADYAAVLVGDEVVYVQMKG